MIARNVEREGEERRLFFDVILILSLTTPLAAFRLSLSLALSVLFFFLFFLFFLPSSKTKQTNFKLSNFSNCFSYVWNGRANWEQSFSVVVSSLPGDTKYVGCCFCGLAFIGKDLKAMCKKYSSQDEQVRQTLCVKYFISDSLSPSLT